MAGVAGKFAGPSGRGRERSQRCAEKAKALDATQGLQGTRQEAEQRSVSHEPRKEDKFSALSPGDSCTTAFGTSAAASAARSSSSAVRVIGGWCTAACGAATRRVGERNAPPVIGTKAPTRVGLITVITSAPIGTDSDGA